jgi:Ca-activated chloride channel family protein
MSFAISAIALVRAASAWPGASAQFASGVSLVEVYATVTGPGGEPVTGLTREDFAVTEDGRPEAVTTFAAGEFPLALAVAVDRSFSVPKPLIAGVAGALRNWLRELRPQDEVMVIAIGSETEVLAPLSSDRRLAGHALARLDRWGTTALHDSVGSALSLIQAGHGRRALVLLSDGKDRYSVTSAADVLQQARGGDVLVYPIGLGRERSPWFAELASATGGRSFGSSDVKQLPSILTTIARELRFQYLLGYVPSRSPSERSGWRSIRVKVTRPGVQVRARDGYFQHSPN